MSLLQLQALEMKEQPGALPAQLQEILPLEFRDCSELLERAHMDPGRSLCPPALSACRQCLALGFTGNTSQHHVQDTLKNIQSSSWSSSPAALNIPQWKSPGNVKIFSLHRYCLTHSTCYHFIHTCFFFLHLFPSIEQVMAMDFNIPGIQDIPEMFLKLQDHLEMFRPW